MPLYTIVHKHNQNGSKDFSVLVASPITGEISDITNYFAIAAGIKLINKKDSNLHQARYNPGYDITTYIKDTWKELTNGKSKKL